MKVVVTGASGFLGSWVCRVLAKNHAVVALVRPESSEYRLSGITPIEVAHIEEDKWGEFISTKNFDAWISLDWNGVSNRNRNDESQIDNLSRVRNLCGSISNVPFVIGTGSQAELGPINDLITESHPDSPTTRYGAAKVEARNFMKSHFEAQGVDFAWARIFSTYGPLDSNDWLIPSIIESLLNNHKIPLTRGEQEWSYLHAYDLATAFESILNKRITGIVNVGNPSTVKIHEVAEFIGKTMNRGELLGFGEVEYRPDQVMKLAPICEKLRESGWKPEIDLNEGVLHLINWMSKKQDVLLKTSSGQELELRLPPRQN